MNFCRGDSIVNLIINNLGVELHLPGYRFCGPGTKLEKRINQDPINTLDSHCKQHDLFYLNNKDLSSRHKADEILENQAWKRVKAKDTAFGERSSAVFVAGVMKSKRKLGMGLKNKQSRQTRKKRQHRIPFRKAVVNKVKHALKSHSTTDIAKMSATALKAARKAVHQAGGRKNIVIPRVIPLPKSGGILPLIPAIFAGLSSLGALAGGASSVVSAINSAKAAKKQLIESERHNRSIEAHLLKGGSGVYIDKYKKGLGLYLKKQTSKN